MFGRSIDRWIAVQKSRKKRRSFDFPFFLSLSLYPIALCVVAPLLPSSFASFASPSFHSVHLVKEGRKLAQDTTTHIATSQGEKPAFYNSPNSPSFVSHWGKTRPTAVCTASHHLYAQHPHTHTHTHICVCCKMGDTKTYVGYSELPL